MARSFSRPQQLENRAFLAALLETGNIRLAAREIGKAYGTMQHRRRVCAAFAQRWDATLAMAQARLAAHGLRSPQPREDRGAHRTAGGEPVVVRRNDGRLQVRRAQPGKLTQACEQAFLAALSATANVALSAAAAGAAEAAFYRRRRQNKGFAREMRLALQAGYDRLEEAMLAASLPASHEDDAWRHNDPPPIPPTTADQALRLMALHQKEARLLAEPGHITRRRGETKAGWTLRLDAMGEARKARDYEEFLIAEAAMRAGGDPAPFEPAPPALPDLAQVTGWSKADPAKAGEPLFGGRRLAKGSWKP